MIDNFPKVEDQVEEIVRNLIHEKQYVEFLVGRDGDFDQIVTSTVRRVKRAVRDDNSVLVWVMPYPKAEYEDNTESFDSYMMRLKSVKNHARHILRLLLP